MDMKFSKFASLRRLGKVKIKNEREIFEIRNLETVD